MGRKKRYIYWVNFKSHSSNIWPESGDFSYANCKDNENDSKKTARFSLAYARRKFSTKIIGNKNQLQKKRTRQRK